MGVWDKKISPKWGGTVNAQFRFSVSYELVSILTNWGSSEQSKNHMLLYYFNFIAKVRKILKSTLTPNPRAVPEKTWLRLKRKPKAAREYWSFPVIYNKSGDIWWQFAVYILKTDEQWKKPRLLSMTDGNKNKRKQIACSSWSAFPPASCVKG